MKQIYVIVKCEDLSDQWECDAKKQPIMVLINAKPEKLERFKHYGYEIYIANKDGTLKLIQNYTDYEWEEEVD